MPSSMEIKKKLFTYCEKQINENISILRAALNDSQESANSETKGSAGDKHETGRAMMHLENEMNAKQLAERLKLAEVLQRIDPDEKHYRVQLGSLVICSNGNYFISVAIGKTELEGVNYLLISAASPIGALLMDKKKGDNFTFNGKSIMIESVV